MKTLITGAGGFIGSNLVEYLHNKDVHMLGMDIDKSRNHLIKDFNLLMVNENVKYIENLAFKDMEINKIYHLASASDIEHSSFNPCYDLAENVVATHNLLEFMRKQDIRDLIFSSTSVVYGENPPRPTPEFVGDFRPTSQYAASKNCVESFIHAYANTYGLRGWIFRFGNVVGKNAQRGVIFDFINKLNKNPKELEILGDGSQVKSYVHVSDVVNAITWMPENDGNKNVETYNIATFDQCTVVELANIVCDELKLKPKFNFTGGSSGWKGDVPKVVLSIDKATKTGWRPKLNCEYAIRKAVKELAH